MAYDNLNSMEKSIIDKLSAPDDQYKIYIRAFGEKWYITCQGDDIRKAIANKNVTAMFCRDSKFAKTSAENKTWVYDNQLDLSESEAYAEEKASQAVRISTDDIRAIYNGKGEAVYDRSSYFKDKNDDFFAIVDYGKGLIGLYDDKDKYITEAKYRSRMGETSAYTGCRVVSREDFIRIAAETLDTAGHHFWCGVNLTGDYRKEINDYRRTHEPPKVHPVLKELNEKYELVSMWEIERNIPENQRITITDTHTGQVLLRSPSHKEQELKDKVAEINKNAKNNKSRGR